MTIVLILLKGGSEAPHARNNVTNHAGHQNEKDESLEALPQIQLALGLLEKGALRFEYLEDSDQSRELYQFIHPANTSYSDDSVHIGVGLALVDALLIL